MEEAFQLRRAMRHHRRSLRGRCGERCLHLLPREHCERRPALPHRVTVIGARVDEVL